MSPEQNSRPASPRRRGSRAPNGYAVGQATRVRLIEAAEALFADRGIAGVSLNEVRTAAGQSNAAAVNYYFGSKEQLLKAILEHRLGRIEADRAELLRALDDDDRVEDPRAILGALIHPQVGSIERGERYVGFIARLVTGESGGYSEHTLLLADPELVPGGRRVDALLRALLAPLPGPVADRRLMFLYTSALQSLAQYQRQRIAGTAPPAPRYVAELIDILGAVLTAPMSAETRTLCAPGVHPER